MGKYDIDLKIQNQYCSYLVIFRVITYIGKHKRNWHKPDVFDAKSLVFFFFRPLVVITQSEHTISDSYCCVKFYLKNKGIWDYLPSIIVSKCLNILTNNIFWEKQRIKDNLSSRSSNFTRAQFLFSYSAPKYYFLHLSVWSLPKTTISHQMNVKIKQCRNKWVGWERKKINIYLRFNEFGK